MSESLCPVFAALAFACALQIAVALWAWPSGQCALGPLRKTVIEATPAVKGVATGPSSLICQFHVQHMS